MLVGSSNISLQRDFLCKMLIYNRFENSKYRIMKKMRTILIFIYCSKNTFLRVLGPRLQIEIFDFPDYFFSNARTLTGGEGNEPGDLWIYRPIIIFNNTDKIIIFYNPNSVRQNRSAPSWERPRRWNWRSWTRRRRQTRRGRVFFHNR